MPDQTLAGQGPGAGTYSTEGSITISRWSPVSGCGGGSVQNSGGTAEVVDWRRHPGHIPPEFCTDPPRRGAAGNRLIVIDPALGYTPARGTG